MPAGNRRGPSGQGPMTGRRQGYCSGNDQPGYMSDAPGMGMGRGGGFGRAGSGYGRGFENGYGRGFGPGRGMGRRSRAYPRRYVEPVTFEEEAGIVEGEISHLEEELAAAKRDLEEIKNRTQKSK